jgi:DNA-binding Lrp family transcriptional regulator
MATPGRKTPDPERAAVIRLRTEGKYSIRAIAAAVRLSPWTVQKILKAALQSGTPALNNPN